MPNTKGKFAHIHHGKDCLLMLIVQYSLPREENVLDDVANWTVTMRADVIFAKYDVV